MNIFLNIIIQNQYTEHEHFLILSHRTYIAYISAELLLNEKENWKMLQEHENLSNTKYMQHINYQKHIKYEKRKGKLKSKRIHSSNAKRII